MFASILMLKREYGDARIVLDHLVRTAADERIRNDATQQLEQLARFEERRQGTQSGGSGFDAADRPAAGPPAAGSGFVPILRPLQEGENRIAARLRAIECGPHGIGLVLEQDGGAEIRLRAPRFEEVEFIAYRDDLSGQITCGERKPADLVYVTYRPDAAHGGAGLLVAVEFLPEGFAP